MSKPTSKEELLDACEKNYNRLNSLVDSYSVEESQKTFPQGTLNRNIRDVLAHLHHWHLLFLRWYEEGMSDKIPDIPAPGYSWKRLPTLNQKIWKEYQNTKLDTIRKQLDISYQQVHTLIEQHTDKELFEKRKYKWTGTTSLGAYLISNTSSHYNWALKMILRGMT